MTALRRKQPVRRVYSDPVCTVRSRLLPIRCCGAKIFKNLKSVAASPAPSSFRRPYPFDNRFDNPQKSERNHPAGCAQNTPQGSKTAIFLPLLRAAILEISC